MTIAALSCFAQESKWIFDEHVLSNEDLIDYHLYKSKKDKKLAIGSVVLGPLITATGLAIMNKGGAYTIPGSTQESNNDFTGRIIAGGGLTMIASGIMLFISSHNSKKKAQLLLSNQSVGLLNQTIQSAGISFTF